MRRLISLLLPTLFALLTLLPATPVAAVTSPEPGAVAKLDSFVIVPPWEQGIERLIYQGYGDLSTHQYTDRAGGPNDYHALDIAFGLDETVTPVAPGRVVYAGPATDTWSFYGNIVFIDHENGYQSFYAHLNTIDSAVLKGAGDSREVRVTTTTRLGGAGRTGGWSTVHLHFALYKGASFNTVGGRYGPYGGQAAVPERFSACVRDGERPCEDLLKGMKLRRLPASGEAPAPLQIAIRRPTTAQPALAGDPARPGKFVIELDLSAADLARAELAVSIGQARAEVVVFADGHRARVEVLAPPQAGPGLYDLSVTARGIAIVVPQAVRYADTGAVAVALVIDCSGSMSGAKLAAAIEAAKQFVDLMRPGDQIAVVSFGTSARVAFPLQVIAPQSDTARSAARHAIQALRAWGSTAIGDGLRRSQDEFDERALPGLARAVVLLSDGHENVSPTVATILPRLLTAGTALYSVGYGGDADQAELLRWADLTGGTYHFAPAPDQLSAVYGSVAGTVGNRQTLRTNAGTMAAGATHSEPVFLDASVRDATFAASWARPAAGIELSLATPSGAVITPATAAATAGVSYVAGSTYAYYHISGPALATGGWTLNLVRSAAAAGLQEPPMAEAVPDHTAALSDTAEDGRLADAPPDASYQSRAEVDITGPEASATPTQSPGEPFSVRVLAESDLTLRLYLSRYGYRVREPVRIIATLSDQRPVMGASITMEIRDSAGRRVGVISLLDNGTNGDGAPADGVYAGYWLSRQEGVHTFVASASGAQGAFIRQAAVSTFIAANPAASPLRQVFLPVVQR